jgi:ribosomal protein L3
MPGQHGNTRSTMQNLKVVRVIADQNLVLIEGAVPGAAEGIVTRARRDQERPPRLIRPSREAGR